MTSISVSMIVRNEEQFLPAALESVRGVADEVIVVDTGSTDRTVAIAKAYGCKVGFFQWCDDFAKARNAALAMCSGDWVFSLDADERLLDRHRDLQNPEQGMVRRVVNSTPEYVHGLFLTCLSGTPGPVDESPVLRLFRRLPHIRFEGICHEEVGMTIQRAGGGLGYSEIAIIHDGYQASIVQDRGKWERNLRMLEREIEERPSGFAAYNLGHCHLVMGNPQLAQPYFADSIARSNPTNLYWSRLLDEARIVGLVLGGAGSNPRMPIDPVVAYGAHPDPLARAA